MQKIILPSASGIKYEIIVKSNDYSEECVNILQVIIKFKTTLLKKLLAIDGYLLTSEYFFASYFLNKLFLTYY